MCEDEGEMESVNTSHSTQALMVKILTTELQEMVTGRVGFLTLINFPGFSILDVFFFYA